MFEFGDMFLVQASMMYNIRVNVNLPLVKYHLPNAMNHCSFRDKCYNKKSTIESDTKHKNNLIEQEWIKRRSWFGSIIFQNILCKRT